MRSPSFEIGRAGEGVTDVKLPGRQISRDESLHIADAQKESVVSRTTSELLPASAFKQPDR
jgi:hypothetical protein